jgi:DNA-binding transcriptional MerR regulator
MRGRSHDSKAGRLDGMMNVVNGQPVGANPAAITIGQLADYAGVTIKTVRHYHRRGLLAEPPRDASGYRRYDAEHAVQLIKVRTLADAGVPLARIKGLLAAVPEQFATAIADIDRNLQARLDQLRHTRERIAQLNAGARLFVSAEIADVLDRLGELGVSQRALRAERDMWILMQAASPTEVATWIADKREH